MRKKILILAIALAFVSGMFVFGNFVFAQSDYGLSEIAGKAELKKSTDLPTLSGQLLGVALSFVGVIFLLLMIYGGILWMTARGNSAQTDKAMNIIISATIGLVIVLGSYAITKFLFTSVGGGSTSTNPGCVNISPTPGTCVATIDCTILSQSTCASDASTCCAWQ